MSIAVEIVLSKPDNEIRIGRILFNLEQSIEDCHIAYFKDSLHFQHSINISKAPKMICCSETTQNGINLPLSHTPDFFMNWLHDLPIPKKL